MVRSPTALCRGNVCTVRTEIHHMATYGFNAMAINNMHATPTSMERVLLLRTTQNFNRIQQTHTKSCNSDCGTHASSATEPTFFPLIFKYLCHPLRGQHNTPEWLSGSESRHSAAPAPGPAARSPAGTEPPCRLPGPPPPPGTPGRAWPSGPRPGGRTSGS